MSLRLPSTMMKLPVEDEPSPISEESSDRTVISEEDDKNITILCDQLPKDKFIFTQDPGVASGSDDEEDAFIEVQSDVSKSNTNNLFYIEHMSAILVCANELSTGVNNEQKNKEEMARNFSKSHNVGFEVVRDFLSWLEQLQISNLLTDKLYSTTNILSLVIVRLQYHDLIVESIQFSIQKILLYLKNDENILGTSRKEISQRKKEINMKEEESKSASDPSTDTYGIFCDSIKTYVAETIVMKIIILFLAHILNPSKDNSMKTFLDEKVKMMLMFDSSICPAGKREKVVQRERVSTTKQHT